MASLPIIHPIPRKPAALAQYNWLTEQLDVVPEQMDLGFPEFHEIILPKDDTVTLLATENGSQLLVAGFGLYIGKKGERLLVKQGKSICAQVPLMRLQEVIVASRGISFSSDLIEELCDRGIRLACMTSSGKPVALITSPMLTATVETRRAQLTAYETERGADICRWLVAGKLHNQEKLLRYFAKSRDGERRGELEGAALTIRGLRRRAIGVGGSSPGEVRGELMGLGYGRAALLEADDQHAAGGVRFFRVKSGRCSRSGQRGAELWIWDLDFARLGCGDECGAGAVCRIFARGP